MPRQRFDMGSKWLLHNQGKGALLVGGFRTCSASSRCPARSCRIASIPTVFCASISRDSERCAEKIGREAHQGSG
jgi:hypothetical protein